MKNHITKQCKNIPRNNNDALQKMLQAAKDGGIFNLFFIAQLYYSLHIEVLRTNTNYPLLLLYQRAQKLLHGCLIR